MKPILEVDIEAGKNSLRENLKFKHELYFFKKKIMKIRLTFETPELVSANAEFPDKIKIIFYGAAWFVDKKWNIPVNGGPDQKYHNVLIKTLPH